MQITSKKLDSIPVREVSTYDHGDMMTYVSVGSFLCMTSIFVFILTL